MKETLNLFSDQSSVYKKFRPTYPQALYDVILNLCEGRESCWDCGTGNGQVAKELAKHFKAVQATDISINQIEHAEAEANIHYKVERAESTGFANDQFDLVTVGQAVHWFDFQAFNKEVNRVVKNKGIIAIWGYDLLRISKEVDLVIDEFYRNVIGPYWNAERRHIDHNYSTIDFDFNELKVPKDLSIDAKWRLADLVGYLSSWSSVQNYKKANNGGDPITLIIEDLQSSWGSTEFRDVSFPVFMRIAQVIK